MTKQNADRYLVALDAGGTMTDTFLVDDAGNFSLGKYLTNYSDEAISYMGSVGDAASQLGLKSSDIHGNADVSIYTGTIMLNILITGDGKKAGLLVSRGQADTPFLERALTWLGRPPAEKWKLQLHSHTRPMIDRKNVAEVTERISGGNYFPPGSHYESGHVIIPMHEEDVRKGVERLIDNGVEVIGICFLCSYANPVHEERAAQIAREIIKKRGAKVNLILSSQICPMIKESARMKTVLVECFACEGARTRLKRVEDSAKADNYKFDLQTLLAFGGVANIRYPRLYESIVSGPTGGMLGGKVIADLKGIQNLLCADLGGTSFEVGIIVGGQQSLNREPNFAGHRLNMTMLSTDSIGNGTGTGIHVDPDAKRVILGPDSAGSRVGICFKYPDITLSDINVVLGYLSPDNFLGGKVKLDREKALHALEERLAKPLDMGVYEACAGVLDLMHSDLQDHVNDSLLSRGMDPGDFTMVAYGGSGPLHMWGIERGLKLAGLFTVPWAAAFSAFGIAAAEYYHRYEKSLTCSILPRLSSEMKVEICKPMNDAWRVLEQQALKELETEGFSKEKVSFRYGVTARYVGQLFSSWEAPVPRGMVKTIEDVNMVCESFEKTYARIYPTASRFPEAGYLITSVYLEAVVPKIQPKLITYPLKGSEPPKAAKKGTRDVYWDGHWVKSDVWNMELMEPGNRIYGSAMIEHPMTTLPVPPGRYVEMDEHRAIWFKRSN